MGPNRDYFTPKSVELLFHPYKNHGFSGGPLSGIRRGGSWSQHCLLRSGTSTLHRVPLGEWMHHECHDNDIDFCLKTWVFLGGWAKTIKNHTSKKEEIPIPPPCAPFQETFAAQFYFWVFDSSRFRHGKVTNWQLQTWETTHHPRQGGLAVCHRCVNEGKAAGDMGYGETVTFR